MERNKNRTKPVCPRGMRWFLLGLTLGAYLAQISCWLKRMESDVARGRSPSSGKERTWPPQESLLPKRVIAVFGTESSGSTFLATTLGIAAGAFPSNGTAVTLLPDRHGNPGRTIVERVVAKRATSPSRDIEVQHLSLPWGMWFSPKGNCEARYARNTQVLEALVPEPCFRFENEASWPSRVNVTAPSSCREEARISQDNQRAAPWTCGAKCGTGVNDGYALYPRRFFVNVTSHIAWYLARGVDIVAVLSIRDRSISHAGKMRVHCKDETVALREEALAREIMGEALTNFGRNGRLNNNEFSLSHVDEQRAIAVSYEALMSLKQPYLFDLYHKLGIKSTYVPKFDDGNEKYVKTNKK